MSAESELAVLGTDRYELVERLGSGGMGTVYKVFDRRTDSYAALKLLDARSAEALHRFKHEFRAVQDLQHPNLISLGELRESAGAWFFTMELIDGEDFARYVAGDATRLRRALAQLLRGLGALHAAGIAHRDVKPSNILVAADGRLVLLDFGLAERYERHPALGVQPSGEQRLVGTGAYMAPEQIGTEAIGPAADLYAVGVMVFEALTGELPFDGTVLEMLVRKHEHAAPDVRALAPDVPEELAALCAALLERDPARRPTAAQALRSLGDGEPAGERSRRAPSSKPPFVGRAAELAHLRAALAARAARVIVLDGPSGVGKTALVRELADRAAAEGAAVLSGRCYERESVSFKGVDGIVDDLAAHLSASPGAVELPDNAALLAHVFPALGRVEAFRAIATRRREDLQPQELRDLAFGALRELLARIAAERPVLVALDDVQWASADAWAVLDHLTAPPDAPRVLFALTLRTAGDEHERARRAVRRMPVAAETVAVQALAPAEAEQLAAALLARGGDPAAAASVARESEGHPLLLQQLAYYVAEGGEAAGARLDDALRARIERVSARARDILDLVAVAGGPMPHAVIARAADLRFAAYARIVGELRTGHLVRTRGSSPADPVEPYHDRVREATLARLGSTRRKALHRQLANALEDGGFTESGPELAVEHLAAAGMRARAAYHAELAAQRALLALAFEQAVGLFRRALELGEHDAEAARQLRLAMADALVADGRAADAAELYLGCLDGAGPAERLDCQRRAAEQLLSSGHLDRGVAVLTEVLRDVGETLPSTPRRALASLLWQRALLRVRGLRWTPRHPSEIAPSELVRLDVYMAVATSLTLVDNVRGADYQCRFLRRALRVGESERIARALSFEAALLAAQGSRRRARAVAAQLDRWADGGGGSAARAFERLAASGTAVYLDTDWPSALKASEEAQHLLRHQWQRAGWETDTARLFKCFALLHMGELAQLSRLTAAYLRAADARGDRYASVNMRSRLVLRWLAAADAAGGVDDLDDALGSWPPWQDQYLVQHFFALHSYCEVDLYRGDPDAAHARMAEQLGPLRDSLLLRLWLPRGEVDHLRGRIALARAAAAGGGGGAAELIAEARGCARRLARNKLPAPRAWAALLRAGADAIAGNTDAARRDLRAAADALAAGHNALYANAARLLLGDADAVAWARAQQLKEPDHLARVLVPGF